LSPLAELPTEATEDASDPLVGTVLLSKLRVLRRIGAGGAGVVYEVEHLITKHRRALKTLKATSRDSPVQISRFLREAGIAGRLKSPRIVETFDAGRLPDGTPYVLMELLEGRSLGRVLREDGPVDSPRLVRWAVGICEALEAAHAAGVIHRDIKPENVFLVDPHGDEEEAHVKVLDFGVCKALDPGFDEIATLTGEGASVGTPYFMAPEQIEGSDAIDARTDVYALGVTLYQLASGELPYVAPSAAALAVKIERGQHRPLAVAAPGVPANFATVIERAMARHPRDRFASVAELRRELEEIADVDVSIVPLAARSRAAGADELGETSSALVRDTRRSRAHRPWALHLRSGAGRLAIGAGAAAAVALAVVFAPRFFSTSPNSSPSAAPTSDGASGPLPRTELGAASAPEPNASSGALVSSPALDAALASARFGLEPPARASSAKEPTGASSWTAGRSTSPQDKPPSPSQVPSGKVPPASSGQSPFTGMW
jgi:serine/threonine protein kinase